MTQQNDDIGNELNEDNLPGEEENLEEDLAVDYTLQPTDDDPIEHWEGFAESKGWNRDKSKAPPGMFRDAKAFVQFHDKTMESKELKGELSNVTKQLNEFSKQQGEFARKLNEQSEREKQELIDKYEGDKKEAKDTGDIDSYVKADEAIKKLDVKPEEKAEESQEPEVFQTFRGANPELLRTSDKYDADLNLAVENKFNAESTALGRIPGNDEVQAMLNRIVEAEKAKFVRYQAKPQRKPPGTNPVGNGANKVAADPNKLDSASRDWYNNMIEGGNEVQAKIFLESRLGVKS